MVLGLLVSEVNLEVGKEVSGDIVSRVGFSFFGYFILVSIFFLF